MIENPKGPDFEKLDELKTLTENYKILDNIFYLYAPDGIGRSKLAAKVDKFLGIETTARNWRTINKVLELAFA